MEGNGGGEKSEVSGWQHMLISKETMRFAKAAEQNFSTEIFKVAKVIAWRPRAVYEHEDFNQHAYRGPGLMEELTPVFITDRTSYKIDKILEKIVRLAIMNISSAGEVTVRTSSLGCLQLA